MRQLAGLLSGALSALTGIFGLAVFFFSFQETNNGLPVHIPTLLIAIFILVITWFLFSACRRFLETATTINKDYVPRFEEVDFEHDDADELNETEFKFLEKQLWGSLSSQLGKYGYRPHLVPGSTVFGYIYGFIDGFLQQHPPCPATDQIKLLNSMIDRYFYNLMLDHKDLVLDPKTVEKCFAAPDEQFALGVFIGGKEGMQFAEDNAYMPNGLLAAAVELKQSENVNFEDICFRAGKSLRKAVDTTQMEFRKTKAKVQSGTKEGPYCLERVKAGAKKCRYCHEKFS